MSESESWLQNSHVSKKHDMSSLGYKRAAILRWDPFKQQWHEETWSYAHNYKYLFRAISRQINIYREIVVIKNDKLSNLWEDWIKQPITKKDKERLERAKKMQFSEFTDYFLSLFETNAAIKELDYIMRDIYRKEEAHTKMI